MYPAASAPYGEIEYLASLIRGKGSLKQARNLAAELIKRFETLQGALAASREILESIPGLGFEGARVICESNALILSTVYKRMENKCVIANTDELVRFLLWKLTPSKNEQVAVVSLNARNHVIASSVIATGTATCVLVKPETIVSEAIKASASGFVIAHNHPSGNPTPSKNDTKTTSDVALLARRMNIRCLDHIIVADGRWYSFAQHGFFNDLYEHTAYSR